MDPTTQMGPLVSEEQLKTGTHAHLCSVCCVVVCTHAHLCSVCCVVVCTQGAWHACRDVFVSVRISYAHVDVCVHVDVSVYVCANVDADVCVT